MLEAMDMWLGEDALTEAVSGVRRALDSMDATRCRAADQVSKVLDGGWSGRAASAFADAWQDWLDGASVVSRGLAELAEAMAAVDRDLRATDLAAAHQSSALVERLD